MLGYYRYFLALLVASSHLWIPVVWWQGIYAVFGFYVISGYLMTLILKEVYLGVDGAKRYVLNRILRIYPVYWLCLAFGAILVTIFLNLNHSGMNFEEIRTQGLKYPRDMGDWIKNVTMFGPDESRYTISQAWSLRVEMTFYVLMIFLCRRFWIVILWVIASIGICAYQELNGVFFIDRYSTAIGASLAFSLGSLIYYLRQKWSLAGIIRIIAMLAFVIHYVFAFKIWGFELQNSGFKFFWQKSDYGLYLHTVLATFALWAILDSAHVFSGDSKFERLGHYLGNLAYAVFLCHWIVAYIVMILGVGYENKPLFIPLTFIGTNLLAMLIYHCFEHPLERGIRAKIRDGKHINVAVKK